MNAFMYVGMYVCVCMLCMTITHVCMYVCVYTYVVYDYNLCVYLQRSASDRPWYNGRSEDTESTEPREYVALVLTVLGHYVQYTQCNMRTYMLMIYIRTYVHLYVLPIRILMLFEVYIIQYIQYICAYSTTYVCILYMYPCTKPLCSLLMMHTNRPLLAPILVGWLWGTCMLHWWLRLGALFGANLSLHVQFVCSRLHTCAPVHRLAHAHTHSHARTHTHTHVYCTTLSVSGDILPIGMCAK